MSRFKCCTVKVNFMFDTTSYKSRILMEPNIWAKSHSGIIPLRFSEVVPNSHRVLTGFRN